MKRVTGLTSLGFLVLGIVVGGFEALGAGQVHSPISWGPRQIINHQGMQTTGPSVQLAPDGTLHMAWGGESQEAKAVLYLKVPPDSSSLPDPVNIAPPETPIASLHQSPAISLGTQNDVYLTWATLHPQANGKLHTNLLLLSRSLDGGQTFLPPKPVNDDEVVTSHSFDFVTVGSDGSVHISWLDAREGKRDPATYIASSRDQGNTISPNLKVEDSSCVCCRTHVTSAPDGTLYLAWRKVLPDGLRETVVARSTDHGQTFSPSVIVGNDRWAFDGCPHRPATMGVDQDGRLYITWYSEGPDDSPGVYLAMSDDQGKTFTPRRLLNASKGTFPDNPQLAVNPEGHLLVAWEEQSPVRREVVFSVSLDRGRTFSPPQKLNEKKAKSPAVTLNDQGKGVITWLEQIAFPNWSTVVQPLILTTSPS